MRVNAKALMKAGSFRCVHQDDAGKRRPARACLITLETVRAAREIGDQDPSLRSKETSPDVRYGGVLVYIGEKGSSPQQLILPPGEEGGLTLEDGTRFLGAHMFAAEGVLTERRGSDQDPVLSGIRSVFGLVSSAPDEDRFPPGLIAQAYRSALRSAFGPAKLAVSDEALVRKCKADLLRARIGLIDPSHPDAIGYCEPFLRVLDRAGADSRAGFLRLPGSDRIDRDGARQILGRDPFRDGLFGALTTTPPDLIEAIVIPNREAEEIDRTLCGSRLQGVWAEEVSRLGSDLTNAGSDAGWYQIELTVYVSGGRDLMILSDSVGREVGVSLLFSWPSVERRPVLQAPSGPVYGISPQEAPDEAELIRLRCSLSDLYASEASKTPSKEALDV
jgi:hypothetical protein